MFYDRTRKRQPFNTSDCMGRFDCICTIEIHLQTFWLYLISPKKYVLSFTVLPWPKNTKTYNILNLQSCYFSFQSYNDIFMCLHISSLWYFHVLTHFFLMIFSCVYIFLPNDIFTKAMELNSDAPERNCVLISFILK